MAGGELGKAAMEPTWAGLVATTAISVATVLGTGVLALPVTLHVVGLPPFLTLFTVTLLAQIGVVYAMTELLQRAYMQGNEDEAEDDAASSCSSDTTTDDSESESGPSKDRGEVLRIAPSFHSISKLYLPLKILRVVFEGAVLLHFVSIMISYSLAAPQVISELVPAYKRLGLQPSIALFVTVASLLIVTMADVLYPFLTGATCVKGVLLCLVIGLTLFLALEVGLAQHMQWGMAMVESFLVGSMALGGIVNLMPVTFETCLRSTGQLGAAVTQRFVLQYRRASLAAVLVSYLLNVGWCISVLYIVPTDELLAANKAGHNSTWPLIGALKKHGYAGAVFLITLFTAISVTVSFFVMGIGMKHTLDDQLRSLVPRGTERTRRLAFASGYYLLWYGGIGVLALANPHAFIHLLASLTSFALNVESGIFIVYMLLRSRLASGAKAVPASLSRGLLFLLGGYFTVAVLVDLALYIL